MKPHVRPLSDAAPRVARVVDIVVFHAQQRLADRDAKLNQQWDELTRLAADAWTWRDPESLAALQDRLTELQAQLRQEWPE